MLNHAEKWVLAGVRINLARKWKRASLTLITDKNFTKRNLHVYPCANYVQSFPKADTRSWNSSHSVTTEPKGHQFYNIVTLKKISHILWTSTHWTLNIHPQHNQKPTKHVSAWCQKKICPAPYLDTQELYSWRPRYCILEALESRCLCNPVYLHRKL